MRAITLAIFVFIADAACAADEGGYVGAALGDASVTTCQSFASTGGGTCGSSEAFRVFGGYAFNRALAIEAGLSDLGSIGTAFELSGVVSLPFSEHFAAYGKLGAVSGDSNSNYDRINNNVPKLGDATVGVGLRIDVSPRFAVRLEYQIFEGVDLATLGALLRFE